MVATRSVNGTGPRRPRHLADPDAEDGNHLYYRLDETAGEVEILLVWNAAAGKSPDV